MILIAAMLSSLLTVGAMSDYDRSGNIGTNARWHYDSSKSTVTISGTGAIDGIPYSDISDGQTYFSVDKLIIGEGITSIANISASTIEPFVEDYFGEMVRFSSVELPASLVQAENNPFLGHRELTSIVVDDSNTKFFVVDGSVLYERLGSGNLRIVSAPSVSNHSILEGTTQIGKAFAGNINIVSLSIPEGVDDFDFTNCSSLLSVKLPDSLSALDSHVFWGCVSLARIDIPQNVKTIASGSSWEGVRYRDTTTLYFHGDKAPELVYDLADADGDTSNNVPITGWNANKLIVYYPENASNWDVIVNVSF